MTTHAILIPNQIAAQNIDSYTRSAVHATASVDNGNVVLLSTGLSTTAGEAEVFAATTPSTGGGLTDVWMAYEPELVWTGSYRGLDPDVRNFYTAALKMFSVFKPQLHDIFTLSGAGIGTDDTTAAASYINCTNGGGLKLEWETGIGSSVFAAAYLATVYISLGDGGIDNQRVTAYKFEVVHV
jgi:hypothetical protein